MEMKKLESVEQFDAIKSEGKSVFMFSADWCGDCKFIEPVMPEIEAENEDFVFYHVDRDEFIDLCADLAIFGIPSFLALKTVKKWGVL